MFIKELEMFKMYALYILEVVNAFVWSLLICSLVFAGTSVFQVTASDADDPTYGNSAKIVYSILEGQPYFSVDPKTGKSAPVFTLKTF